MTQDVCLDANILLGAVLPQKYQEACTAVVGRFYQTDAVLFEPGLMIFEAISVLHRNARSGDIFDEEMERAIRQFSQLPIFIEWQPQTLIRTAKWAKTLGMPNAYDASYLAVAEARNVPLVTMDKELIRKAKPHFRDIWSVEEFLSTLH